jgi:hypothetical protein
LTSKKGDDRCFSVRSVFEAANRGAVGTGVGVQRVNVVTLEAQQVRTRRPVIPEGSFVDQYTVGIVEAASQREL